MGGSSTFKAIKIMFFVEQNGPLEGQLVALNKQYHKMQLCNMPKGRRFQDLYQRNQSDCEDAFDDEWVQTWPLPVNCND